MDWFDFLEEATTSVSGNQEASDMRRELLHHLETITAELMSEGWNKQEAMAEAQRRMGSPNEIADAFITDSSHVSHPSLWIICWFILAFGAVGMTLAPLLPQELKGGQFFTILTALAVIGLAFLQTGAKSSSKERLSIATYWIRTNWVGFSSALGVGILEGSRPVWMLSPITMPSYCTLICVILMAALTGFAVLYQFVKGYRNIQRWSPGILAVGMGLAFGISSTVTALMFGIAWPQAPSPFGDWFGTEFLQQNSHLLAIYTFGIWFPGVVLGLVTTWWVEQRKLGTRGATIDH